MYFQNQVENEKFLMIFGSPFKSMCCSLFTLKSGVIIVGVIDVMLGIASVTGAVALITIMIGGNVNYI